jgi:putative DNA primase/helicase
MVDLRDMRQAQQFARAGLDIPPGEREQKQKRRPRPKNGHALTAPNPASIRVAQGDLHQIVLQAQELLAAQSEHLFQHGGQLVHIVRVTRTLKYKDGRVIPEGTVELVPVTKEWLQLELCRLRRWERFDARQVDWIRCDPPMKIASGVLADPAGWRARVLNGITEIPIVRPDGSICDRPGYDEATGLYFDPNGRTFPPIVTPPTRKDALAALALLEEPLRDFPFLDPFHKSAAVAMILTAVIRRQLTRAPAFGVSAREAGTGKGLLVDVVALIATGRASPITRFTDDEGEQRKRITAALLAGHPLINIDNVTEPIDSAALSALLTSEIWSERILGVSQDAKVPSNALVVMTGNNLIVQGDMTRRVLLIELDAKCERPELRTFDRDLLPWVAKNRPHLVADALTVISAWRHAGRPMPKNFQKLGSYEEWSHEIAACLVQLGRPNPLLAMEPTRANDPRRALLRRIAANWYALFDKSEQTINAVMQAVEPGLDERPEAAELREAMLEATPYARTDLARRTLLGNYLRTNKGRVVSITHDDQEPLSLRFREGKPLRRAVRWRVEHV